MSMLIFVLRDAPSPTSSVPTKAARTHARILAAGRRLFARDGFAMTTTRAIAAEAGVAHGTLFRYAPTKEDLVEQLFSASIGAALTRAGTTAPAGPFVDVALHFYGAFFDVYGEDERLACVLVRELPFLQGDARERERQRTFELLAHLVTTITREQGDGTIAEDIVPMVAATSSFSLYFGALVAWLSGQLDRDGAWSMLTAQHALLARGLRRP
jgi:TetR/AcrR family transcriptional regulator, cholesterol catabolism regulator